ncbi:MAG: deoxyribonuclease V [Dehalococcoidales bacterium]|nr:deoxyribonuclease V [Dehalococcoidales bacterium]
MKINLIHDWQFSVREAMNLQKELAQRVSRTGEVSNPRFIGGVDISVDRFRGTATAAVVVLDYPALEPVEIRIVQGKPGMPYIPGLLSFREAPLILEACAQLENAPDLLLVDGQGIAHPRRLGIAAHLGLWLEVPTIGCAKSRLCGDCKEPDNTVGSYTELSDNGEVIGAVLRTRNGVKPVYISTGHKINQLSAVQWVLRCCRGYRLPEPVRYAHLAAGGNLKPSTSVASVI